jgi:hypothetical protein
MHPDLPFIQLKINAIATALFFCSGDAPLPFSAYVVTALKMDDEGCIWFFVRRGPYENIVFGKAFDAELEFYRKGYPWLVKVFGVGTVEYAEPKAQELIGTSICLNQLMLSGILLVKVKMENASYRELKVFSPIRFVANSVDRYRKMIHRIRGQWQSSPVVYQ